MTNATTKMIFEKLLGKLVFENYYNLCQALGQCRLEKKAGKRKKKSVRKTKTTIAIRFNRLQVCQPVPSLYFVCVIYTFIECSEWLF